MSADGKLLARKNSPGSFCLLASVWSFIGFCLAAAYNAADWQASLGLLMIGQAFCASLVTQRFARTQKAILPDFLTVYLLMLFINKTVTAIAIIVFANSEAFGSVGSLTATYQTVPLKYQFRAELVFLLATGIFAMTWISLERGKILAIWGEPSPRIMWWASGVSLLIYLALSINVVLPSLGMTQELMRLFSIGAIAVLLGGHSRFALGRPYAWLPILALLPMLVLALRSGMKGEVALVMLPILLTIFRRPTSKRIVFLGSFLVFVLLFLFPFSTAWREANWIAKENVGIPVVTQRVITKWDRDGIWETAAESTAQWLTRASSAKQGGLVMQIAERDGLIGPVLIEGLGTIFIPRFLWPEKPSYRPGAWFTWYLGKASSPETATTSTAMMLPTELYWMFGVSGVVGGMALLGLLYVATWRFLSARTNRGVIFLLALFALMSRSAGLHGVPTIYVASSPIILVVYVIAFDFMQRLLLPHLSRFRLRRQGLC